jgi:hypothetical protein
MAYPLSLNDQTTPILHGSLLIPKAGKFAKVGIADAKNLGFGFPFWGLDGRRKIAMIGSRHGVVTMRNSRCRMTLDRRYVPGDDVG